MAMLHQLVSMSVFLYRPCSSYDITNLSIDAVDYTNISMQLIFSADNTMNCRNIPINDDELLEGTENLFGNLTTVDPDVILAPDVTEILILEDQNDSMFTVIRGPIPQSTELQCLSCV